MVNGWYGILTCSKHPSGRHLTRPAPAASGRIAPFDLAANAFADTGSQLNDMAARTGVSVEALSELGYAAQRTSSSLEGVEKTIRVMQRTITAAVNGSDLTAQAQVRVGPSAESLALRSAISQADASLLRRLAGGSRWTR